MLTLLRTDSAPRSRLVPYLNVGCGERGHPDWINLDLHPRRPHTLRHDAAAAPLPFAPGSFAAVYLSHVLEHVPAERASFVLVECRRVLRPGGILRIVVPDLEQIASLYAQTIERAWHGDDEARRRHRWFTMELLDQMTRERPGGRMLDLVAGLRADELEFVRARLGAEGRALLETRAKKAAPGRWRGWLFGSWRERLVRWLLGAEYDLLRQARFRASGEVHRWMYDRVSLRAALRAAGFADIRLVGPSDSAIPDWASFNLDTLEDGSVAKPDSLFMEARNV
jgi:predicted SAM-dependent methyltransferase